MNNYSKTAIACLFLGVIAALFTVLSGYGYQWNLWGLYTAFRILIPAGAIAAVLALVTGIGYLIAKRSVSGDKNRIPVAVSILLSVVVVLNFGYWYKEIQKGYPPIHDITTDTQHPPEFVAVKPLRADAPNKTDYGGAEVARMQEAYYHDIQPLYLDMRPSEAYEIALEAAKDEPWTIVEAEMGELRIEAYHKLPWFGFIDDVVVRVDTADTGSRIDVRSVSRVGRGDLGVNAERIRDYLNRIRQQN